MQVFYAMVTKAHDVPLANLCPHLLPVLSLLPTPLHPLGFRRLLAQQTCSLRAIAFSSL